MSRALTIPLLLALTLSACGDSSDDSAAPPDPNNAPPIARLAVPTQASVGETVLIDASTSMDTDGEIVSYLFTIGDSPLLQSRSPVLAHTFTESGQIMAIVTVIDDQGTKATERATIFVAP